MPAQAINKRRSMRLSSRAEQSFSGAMSHSRESSIQDPSGADSHIFAGRARARYLMRMNYWGFSAVNASNSIVRRANLKAAAQAGQVSYDLHGPKAGAV